MDDLAEQVEDWDAIVDELRLESTESIERDERLTVLHDRERWNEHDVFLSYDHRDKPIVRQLAQSLRDFGILPWLDEHEIRAGDNFIQQLEEIIERVPVVAITFGPHWPTRQQQDEYERYLRSEKKKKPANWQQLEYYALLNQYMNPSFSRRRRQLRIVPVLLPGLPQKPTLPIFLRSFDWIDFRDKGLDSRAELRRLVQSILDSK